MLIRTLPVGTGTVPSSSSIDEDASPHVTRDEFTWMPLPRDLTLLRSVVDHPAVTSGYSAPAIGE